MPCKKYINCSVALYKDIQNILQLTLYGFESLFFITTLAVLFLLTTETGKVTSSGITEIRLSLEGTSKLKKNNHFK